MRATVLIEEAGASRQVDFADLPLVIGGPKADIRPSGIADEFPFAHIGLDEEELFIQPTPGSAGVLCNGYPLATSQWLRDGDVVRLGTTQILVHREVGQIRLVVEQGGREVGTDPPVIVAAAPRGLEGDSQSQTTVKPIEFTPKPWNRGRRRRWAVHPLLILTWAALAILAVAAWFLFTSRSVEIRIEPEPEEVVVEGSVLKLEFGGRYLLRPGQYRVIAERPGYRRLETSFEVSRQSSQIHEFILEMLPGRLALTTVPADGVQVMIDGQLMGTTPLEPADLSPGEHTVEVRAERYEPATTTVSIAGAGTLASLQVELSPLWADVSFDSKPAGATLRVDGETVGRTPITAELLQGGHVIELRLAGFKPYRTDLNVLARQPKILPPTVLLPVDGWLVLTSEPSDATVSIDGEFNGQTPLELELVPGVEHRIRLSKLGHDTVSDTIRLESGGTRELHVRLDARFGEIEIVSRPADAELLVDGEVRGRAAQTLRLAAVPHEIEVRKAGYEGFKQTVTPRPGFPQVLEVSLRTEEEAREASRLQVIQGPQGQELRLIDPGSFRMGASRREPGRRANETLREVELTRPFYLATEEISNREFREFMQQHRSGHAGGTTLDKQEHPVVQVSWEDAARYCNWLSSKEGLSPAYVQGDGRLVGASPMTNGYRLPTEAEWAWAARFAGRAAATKYPWGDSLPAAAGSGNFADASASGIVDATLSGYNDSYATTAPVDSFEPNPIGILNLGGNVAEWVHDIYTIYPSGSAAEVQDPMGPEEGQYHVIRGSSWMDSTITELRLSFRDYGNKPRADVGFRIARYAD